MKSHIHTNLGGRLIFASILFASVAGLHGKVFAQIGELSREPVLRIETGMHTGAVIRIAVDRANKYLVTASHDNTLRVWEIATGRLLRVLRVPIGFTKEGKLFSVAISPDGKTIAAGGASSVNLPYGDVYLFDRESGKLLRRLSGFTTAVQHLVFSPDGAMLAACVGVPEGVFLWRTSDWAEIGRGSNYADGSYGADFDGSGRLVTSCADGSIRVYDSKLNLLNKQNAPNGKQLFGVRFSPDRRYIAVGYVDVPRVDVLEADTLKLAYSPDSSDLRFGNLGAVAWSEDGKTLYATGQLVNFQGSHIRHWSQAGQGPHQDTLVATTPSTIYDLATLRAGGIVYGASPAAWGILDANHQPGNSQTGQVIDYRSTSLNLGIDEKATTISFQYRAFQPAAVLRVLDRTLGFEAPNVKISPALVSAPGLLVTDWFNGERPRVNSVPIKLEPHEISRSLAITPDGKRFLLGTSYYMRLFSQTGQEIGRLIAPGDPWAINISADGRFAVAAFADGTIRWYSLVSGQETLAFFLHPDLKRWVIWTPSGYYDASPGAESLIGWHVNNGKDQGADFFPVGQFRSTYYRPDLIARVLQMGDEQLALREVNAEAGRKTEQTNIVAMLPPVVEILSPADASSTSSSSLTVRFRVRTPSGEPVTNVRALVDGRPIAAGRQLVRPNSESDVNEMQVTIPERDSEVSIIAENRFAPSVPATLRLKWTGAAAKAETFAIKPKLYILAVGVSKYENPKYQQLRFADKDAQDFVNVMLAQKDLLYRDVIVYRNQPLINEQATRDEIVDGLDWIRKETTSNDVAMVFLSGHGVNDPNDYYYFCPYNIDSSRLLRTGVAFSDIRNTVKAIAGKAVFFVDSCHSGNSLGLGTSKGNSDINIVINELSSVQNGGVVFSASTAGELSLERSDWANGAFTKALVEGLKGAAAVNSSGKITYTMLGFYVSERVKELTVGAQHPTMISPNTVPDFPIAVKR